MMSSGSDSVFEPDFVESDVGSTDASTHSPLASSSGLTSSEVAREMTLYGLDHVVRLYAPLTIAMAVVAAIVHSMEFYTTNDKQTPLSYAMFETSTTSSWSQLLQSIGNALCIIAYFALLLVVYVLLYYFKCHKLLSAWVGVSTFAWLSALTALFSYEVLVNLDLSISSPTFLVFIANYSLLGVFCVFFSGPCRLQQFYLVAMCVQMALLFVKYLPDWTLWALLGLLCLWDIFAVLCPFGPLRILTRLMDKRGDRDIPGLLYTATIIIPILTMTESESVKRESIVMEKLRSRSESTNIDSSMQQPTTTTESEVDEDGIRLGLGDFIFYSVLVGKAAASHDWNLVIACYVAIIAGATLTMVLLMLYNKALPALPISLFLGGASYFAVSTVASPFASALDARFLML